MQIESPDWIWLPALGVLHVWNPEDDLSDRINPLLIVSVTGEQNWAAEAKPDVAT